MSRLADAIISKTGTGRLLQGNAIFFVNVASWRLGIAACVSGTRVLAAEMFCLKSQLLLLQACAHTHIVTQVSHYPVRSAGRDPYLRHNNAHLHCCLVSCLGIHTHIWVAF